MKANRGTLPMRGSEQAESVVIPRASVIFVCYGRLQIDHAWIPPNAPIFAVHNDHRTDRAAFPARTTHLVPADNLGYGGGINLALREVRTERVIMCNPDVRLTARHFTMLAEAEAEEVVSAPLLDEQGRPTSVINRYPTPLSLVLTAWRVGRFAKRGSAARRFLAMALGTWGEDHVTLTAAGTGTWPLASHWVSGAVMSIATERLRAVGGFSDRFFLYMEDVDLCKRLAHRFPAMVCRLENPPGTHAVGGSVTSRQERLQADHHRAVSFLRYARAMRGVWWTLAAMAVWPLTHEARDVR